MATSQVQTVSTGADKAKLAAAALVVLAALVAYYLLLAKQGHCAVAGLFWACLLQCLSFCV
jgi:preprotein translocase subunit SecE